ncbi:hypothetical protein D3C76_338520 [compost metagenome]|uniref:Uncharacterized protein n=1 Tax=Pseudomonas putida TaxID=303 RepID=A0A7D5W065_PSEPU|nr:hypothetical protein [Pseudomonas putida]QLJ15087.1 hypothetical protein H0H12_03830 [Pseudomonas putida]
MSGKDGGKESGYYYDLGKAWGEVRDNFANGTNRKKISSAASLVGKALSNVAVHVMNNGQSYADSATTSIKMTAERRKLLVENYMKLPSSELLAIYKEGAGGVGDEERNIAFRILLQRKKSRGSD